MVKGILRSEGIGAAVVLVLSGTVAALAAGGSRVPSLGLISGLLSNPVPRPTTTTASAGARSTGAPAATAPPRAAA